MCITSVVFACILLVINISQATPTIDLYLLVTSEVMYENVVMSTFNFAYYIALMHYVPVGYHQFGSPQYGPRA